jgi:hypothetical protein
MIGSVRSSSNQWNQPNADDGGSGCCSGTMSTISVLHLLMLPPPRIAASSPPLPEPQAGEPGIARRHRGTAPLRQGC